MFDKLNNMGRGFTFISFLTGITTVIVAFFVFALMKYGVSISLKDLFEKISKTSFFELLFYIAVFTIGFFIHGIRYWGFDCYRRLYEEYKQEQEDKKDQKCKKNQAGKGQQKKMSWFMKIMLYLPKRTMFYMFRKGTVIEECLNEKRHSDTTYNWIRISNKPEADVWNHAKKISLEFPQVDVYQFYYHSEAFQCFDTVFFIYFFVTFCIGMFGIFSFVVTCEYIDRKYLQMLVFSLVLFLIHLICKGASRAFARRFFLEIQVDLNVLNKRKSKN